MKKFLFIASSVLFSVCLISSNALADGLVGISTFGIKSNKFDSTDCQSAIKMATSTSHPAIAVLFKTFGHNTDCLNEFWKTTEEQGKQHITEIHISNEAGRRNSNLGYGDFLNTYNVSQYNALLKEMPVWFQSRIKRRVHAVKRMIRHHKNNGYFILSTGLEDNFTKEGWTNLYNEIKKYWPYAIARNSVKSNAKVAIDDVWDERHSYDASPKKPNRCILNGDGQDVDFLTYSGQHTSGFEPASYEKVQSWVKTGIENNCIVFLWVAKWQGLILNKKATTPYSRSFYFHKQDVKVIKKLIKEANQNTNASTKNASKILTY